METKRGAEPYEFFSNYEAVLSRFGGHWPGFPGGEVLRIIVDPARRGADGHNISTVELHLRTWSRSWKPGSDWVNINDSVIQLFFEDVFEFQLQELAGANLPTELMMDYEDDLRGEPKVLVMEIKQNTTSILKFKTRKASVLKVEPYV